MQAYDCCLFDIFHWTITLHIVDKSVVHFYYFVLSLFAACVRVIYALLAMDRIYMYNSSSHCYIYL